VEVWQTSNLRRLRLGEEKKELECGPMPNVMVALPNIGGTLCSTPQVWVTPTIRCRAVTLPRRETSGNLQVCLKLPICGAEIRRGKKKKKERRKKEDRNHRAKI